VYLATCLISNIVTNNAAAALVFPIAMTAAEDTGADLVVMSYSVMLGASASFMTPFGYQLSMIFSYSLFVALMLPVYLTVDLYKSTERT
jgi:di/tricarboxylate transporter